jgi:integrase
MASIRVRQNKNGSTAYVVRVYAGSDENGRSRYLSKTYAPVPGTGKNKIRIILQDICADLESRANTSAALRPGLRFCDYARHFLQKKSLSVTAYTLQSYRLALKKACCYLGSVPLDELNARHLDDMTARMQAQTSQYGRPYSPAYIRHVQTLVKHCLDTAVQEGALAENPADRSCFTRIRQEGKTPVFLELEEAQRFAGAALSEGDPKIRCMVLLYLYTGMRMEELCGLEWRDIDFSAGTISVRRASVYVAGQGVITKDTKSRSGVRTIRADPIVFDALQAHLEAMKKAWEKAALPWREDARLFTKRDGTPLIPGTTRIWLRRFEQRNGLKDVTPHKLRHTFATLQIAYGTDIRTVAGVMGHSSPMTTLTIYAHQVKEASEKASQAMSAMLNPKNP